VTDTIGTKPPQKRIVKAPDPQQHHSDKTWKERDSRMKIAQPQNLPKQKTTVGDLFNKKKKETK